MNIPNIVHILVTVIFLILPTILLYQTIKLRIYNRREVVREAIKTGYSALNEAHKVLRETAFRNKTFYWDRYTLDCTNFANDIKQELMYLKKLQGDTSFETKEDFIAFERDIDDTKRFLPVEETKSILESFYDKNLEIFRQHKSAPVNISCIGDAFHTIFEHTKFENKQELKEIEKKFWGKNATFIIMCYDEESGFFKLTPLEDKRTVTVSTTFSGFLTLHQYLTNPFETQSQLKGFKNLKTTIKTLNDKYKSRNEESGNLIVGFKEREGVDEQALVCATFYAIRIALCLSKVSEIIGNGDEPIKFTEFLSSDDIEGILNFLEKCYRRDGGFAPQNDPTVKSNIVHTRYALQILRHLLIQNMLTEEQAQKFLQPKLQSIIDFVYKCKRDGGYAFYPDDYSGSTVYATRCGLKTLRYLEQFFKYKKIFVSKTWRADYWKKSFAKKLDSLHEDMAQKTEDYLKKCKDYKDNLYMGFEN